MPYRSRKEPEPPKTRSGRSKRDRLMKKHGDYEPVLWTRIDAFHGLPVQAVAKTHSESHLDPMGPQCRYYVRRHHHAVAYALSAVVTAQANELKSSLPAGESNLLTPKHKLGLMGATKLKAMRLMEKIYRQPKRWWLGLDVYAQHIAVLDQVGHEVLVEWLRTYKPAP